MAAGLEYRLTYYVIDSNNNQYTPYNEDIYNQIGFDPITATFGEDYVEFKDLYESTNIINFETPYNYNGVNYPVSSIHCNGSDAIGKEFDVTDGCVIEVYYGKDPETGGSDSGGPEQGEGNTGGDSGGDDPGELPDSTEFKEFSFIIYRYYNSAPAPTETIKCYWLQRYCDPIDAPDGTIESYLEYNYITKLKPDGTLDENYKDSLRIPKTDNYNGNKYILEKVTGAASIPANGFYTNVHGETRSISVFYITPPTITITSNIPDSIFEIYCSGENAKNYSPAEDNSIKVDSDHITTTIPIANETLIYGSAGIKITLNAIDSKPGTKRYEFEKWEIVEDNKVLTTTEFEFDYEITSNDNGKTFKVYYYIDPDTTGVKIARNEDVQGIVSLYSYNEMRDEKKSDYYCPTRGEIENGCGGMVAFLPKKNGSGYDVTECVQIQHIKSNINFPPVTICNKTGGWVDPFDIYIGWKNETSDTKDKFWAKCTTTNTLKNNESTWSHFSTVTNYKDLFEDENYPYRNDSILFFKFDGSVQWGDGRGIQIELLSNSPDTPNYRRVFMIPWRNNAEAKESQSCYFDDTNVLGKRGNVFTFAQTEENNTLPHINLLTDTAEIYITIFKRSTKNYDPYEKE